MLCCASAGCESTLLGRYAMRSATRRSETLSRGNAPVRSVGREGGAPQGDQAGDDQLTQVDGTL
eukprot:3541635-Pleurochrysis_carterae.AAC.2